MMRGLLVQGTAVHLPFADQSFHCIITSPPYLGMRVYKDVAPTLWPGGSYAPVPGAPPMVIQGPTMEEMAACAHEWTTHRYYRESGNSTSSALAWSAPGPANAQRIKETRWKTTTRCSKCDAWLGGLGEEQTPAEYVWHTLLWLREAWRVLRDDGIVWLNLGDGHTSGNRQGHGTHVGLKQQTNRGMNGTADPARMPQPPGYRHGSLFGIPQQVMLAAMADGWVARNDCVWAKDSCMPESVKGTRWQAKRCACLAPSRMTSGQQRATAYGYREHTGDFTATPATMPDPDCQRCGGTGRLEEVVLRRGSWRHTRSHEPVLMLTKGMQYWADGCAVQEASVAEENRGGFHKAQSLVTHTGAKNDGFGERWKPTGTRNPRSVLRPTTAQCEFDHYAAFPPALVEPLIKASVPAQCCAVCGAGYAPVLKPSVQPNSTLANGNTKAAALDRERAEGGIGRMDGGRRSMNGSTFHNNPAKRPAAPQVESYRPTCACVTDQPPVPGKVLDPFCGSGTTLQVARALGRDGIGLDLSAYYLSGPASERLEFKALKEWEKGGQSIQERFDDLPLFALEEGV